MQIFISYAKEDANIAEKLFQSLSELKEISPWLDSKILLPGMDWEEEIINAIEESQLVILILSFNSVTKTGFFQKEIKKAIDRFSLFPPGHIFIIPIRIDICEPKHEELKKLHYVDMFPDWDRGIQMVVASILREATLKAPASKKEYSSLLDEILSNYSNPEIKEKWDLYPNAFNRYSVSYIPGDDDFNLKAFNEVVKKIDLGIINTEKMMISDVAEVNLAKINKDRYSLNYLVDSLMNETWKIGKDVLSKHKFLFIKDLNHFKDKIAQEFTETTVRKIEPFLEKRDFSFSDKHSKEIISNALHVLYAMIEFQV